MFSRLTDQSKHVLALADLEARRRQHEYIGSEHLLLGLLKEGRGVGALVLKNLGVDFAQASREVDKLVRPGPNPVTSGKRRMTPRAIKVVRFATDEARKLSHEYIRTEHFLLGILREFDGIAALVLVNLGLSLSGIRDAILGEISSPDGTSQPRV